MRVSFQLLLMALLTVLLISGCGTPPSSSATEETTDVRLVWPKPPDQPRIRYLRSLNGPRDLGLTRPLLRRLTDWLSDSGVEHFIRPTGVAVQDGVIYVADPGARALWILDPAQNRSIKLERVGDETLLSPVAVAVRPDGAVFVADSVLKKVYLVDRQGRLQRIAAQGDLSRPAGLAYDVASNRLYVADSADHRIKVYDSSGVMTLNWGRHGNRDGEFNYPTYLSLDRNGSLLVTDALNYRIQVFDREGRFLSKLGRHGDGSGDFAAPKGVATDSGGRVYVVDALFDAVQIFEHDGTLLLGFGEQGSQPGQFWLPGGISISKRGEIYVADSYNQRVQVFVGLPAANTEIAK